jgi:hypothetical protein
MGGMGGMGGGAHESVEQVPCPFQAGAIIGPRGAVIREISEKTGARVVVRGNEAVTGGERVKGTEYVEIKGTPEAVANAVAEVNRILEEKAAMRGSGGGGGGVRPRWVRRTRAHGPELVQGAAAGRVPRPVRSLRGTPARCIRRAWCHAGYVRWVRDAAAHAHGDARRGWRLGPRSVRGC